MDWLSKLPVIGPFVARFLRTHAWRSYETLERVHWTRLAAAITFISFVALFPLLTVAAAIGAALLSDSQLHRVEHSLTDQVPGISKQLDINNLVANAGTVGVVAGLLLLFTGVSWITAMRDCLRAVWEKDHLDQGNPFVVRAKDAVVLVGLSGVGLVSLGASGFGSTAIGWTARHLGISQDGAGGILLQASAVLTAAVADFLILLYVLTLLPRVNPPRRRLFVAAAIGAVGFELLKLLLGGYLTNVAGKTMYGAFGVPIALLLWINFTAKLLLFCAAWTATGSKRDLRRELKREEGEEGEEVAPGPRRDADGRPLRDGEGGGSTASGG
ncbi:YihY/virulence factor BrkB family protein [Streptomyces liangshanensis]|uniref:YihY/virulence factor BrkB family protein n=1 Tax=Streptomyces liangshanensis TaxID=2717324 RepID=A0A6G9GXR1_9ACTN|nr:YihY/virulence factor BrkB family protein [Streptomyces liangshanensis]QIQ03058.1 YihY/virulence factor BrkB family protein [Streptomyces liangshanensis]